MHLHAWLDGPAPAIAAALEAAGVSLAPAPPAAVFITANTDPDRAIANAHAFADAVPPGQEALVVHILPPQGPSDWLATRAAAVLWAFTRHTALAWAPRRIRMNAIALGTVPPGPALPAESAARAAGPAPAAPATPGDIAATVLTLWRLPSMTGQLIRLGAPL
jgi:hypothetical protein